MSSSTHVSHATAAWDGYRAMQREVDARIARDVEVGSGLSIPDYEVLISIAGVTEHCVRVSGLAIAMGWSKSRLSRQLSRMVARGLIAREPCELDGRGDDVVLTDVGREIMGTAVPIHDAAVAEHFTGRLSPDLLSAMVEISAAVRAER